jgi:ornithine cyclodeaminase/alanine dehydrogenase-like protein (mu-crystallin family)
MMQVLVINHKEVGELLPMAECIQVIEEALRALNQDTALNPLRSALLLPDGEDCLP